MPRIAKRFPRLTNLILVIVSCFIVISCVETICYVLVSTKDSKRPKRENFGTYNTQGYFQNDDLLGYKPKASSEISSVVIIDNSKVYDVTYTIDGYHRRHTPVITRENRKKFALFFGCSFTFGEGVNDNETLPYYFSKFSDSYMPYNYGFHGYGPQEMLAKLQDDSIAKEINEKKGIAVYLYLSNTHEQRAIGDMFTFNRWGANMPFYRFDSRHNLIRNGSFLSGRPIISTIYNILGKSYFIKYFEINFPPKIMDRHYRLTSKIIEESRNAYKNKFKNDNFYVLIYPRIGKVPIIPYLDKANVKYIDYSKLFDPSQKQYKIVGDGHPSAEAYKVLAKKLSKYLSGSTIK